MLFIETSKKKHDNAKIEDMKWFFKSSPWCKDLEANDFFFGICVKKEIMVLPTSEVANIAKTIIAQKTIKKGLFNSLSRRIWKMKKIWSIARFHVHISFMYKITLIYLRKKMK